jgi:general secretion pathway protein N
MSSTAPASTSAPSEDAGRFRVGPVRGFLLILLLVLTWVVALVVYLPAGWVWAQSSRGIDLPEQIEVASVSGTLWSGTAIIRALGKPVSVGWHLEPASAIYGFVPLEWKANTANSRAEGSLTAVFDGRLRFLMREAQIDLAEITAMSGPLERVRVPGIMELESVFVVWDQDEGLVDARGRGQWPGGPVSWPMGGRLQQSNLPPLEGVLKQRDQGVVLSIMDHEQGITGVEATLDNDGYASLALRKHWINLLGLDFAANAEPDEVLFNVRRRILQ